GPPPKGPAVRKRKRRESPDYLEGYVRRGSPRTKTLARQKNLGHIPAPPALTGAALAGESPRGGRLGDLERASNHQPGSCGTDELAKAAVPEGATSPRRNRSERAPRPKRKKSLTATSRSSTVSAPESGTQVPLGP